MCLSPIKIRNNSRSYQQGLSPLYREVPCGHCLECQTNIQNDWFVRLAYEYFYTIDHLKGQVYFITLSYNDSELPFNYVTDKQTLIIKHTLQRLSLLDKDISYKIEEFEKSFGFSPLEYIPFGHEYFCFEDIKKFIKSLRQILDYYGMFAYKSENTLKYFVAPEYGHEKHRVHFHVLFFCPFQIDAQKFLEFCRMAWSNRVLRKDCPDFIQDILKKRVLLKSGFTCFSTPNGKNWKDWYIKKVGSHVYVSHLRGNVSYSKKNPPTIQGVEGLRYVVKYLHKKDDYLSSEKFNLLHAYLRLFPRNLVENFGKTFVTGEHYINILRSYFPRVKCSNYLGISILDELQLLSEDTLIKMLSEKSLSVLGVPRLYRVPAYIVNRLMYNVDDIDPSLRRLSDIGINVLRYKYELKVEEFKNKINDTISSLFILCNNEDWIKLRERYPNCDTYANGVLNFNFTHVAKYHLLCRDVLLPKDRSISFYMSAEDTFAYMEDITFYGNNTACIRYDVEVRPCDLPKRQIALYSKYTWNYQPCFAGFDEFLNFFRDAKIIVSKRKNVNRKKSEMERTNLRTYYNALIY